jgi:cell division transport system permease protein
MAKLSYFARETLISLRRNLLMTLAGILTVTVSLFLFGGMSLLSKLVEHGTGMWKDNVEFVVWMKVDATDGQVNEVRSSLESSKQVRRFKFIDKDAAYTEFKRANRDRPGLVTSVSPKDLPTSFRVVPDDAERTALIADQFRAHAGVDEVWTAEKTVKQLLNFTSKVRLLFYGLSLVLLASSLFLIVNTIRLATFARRREIEVMKLVGASNAFVRVPFMAEGLVQGAIGAGLAFAGIYLLKALISRGLANPAALLKGYYLTTGDALSVGWVVLVLGVMIGLLGSVVGLRRFLKV